MADFISQGVQRANITLEAMEEVAKDELVELESEQLSAKDAFMESQAETVNPLAAKMAKDRKKLDARNIQTKKGQESKDKPTQLLPLKDIEEKAKGFQNRNSGLKEDNLILLSTNIKDSDKAEDILKIINRFYLDVTLADEALQFLFEITTGDLHEQVGEAIRQFKELRGRDVEAGKNVAQQAMAATEKALGNYTSLSDLYKDIKDTPRDSATLFDQLSKKYEYKELKAVMDYLLHNLGAHMKTKGTDIPKAELQRLVSATRSLQAINGVYRFFKTRMPLVEKLFKEEGMPIPEKLSFESLSKAFMTLVTERYPSSEKVKQQAPRIGVEDSTSGKIIAFNQCRDGIREVALNQIYRSVQHRDELYSAILDALEEIEEEFEEATGVNINSIESVLEEKYKTTNP